MHFWYNVQINIICQFHLKKLEFTFPSFSKYSQFQRQQFYNTEFRRSKLTDAEIYRRIGHTLSLCQMCSKHNRILVPIFTNLFRTYFSKKIFCQKYFWKKYFFKNIFLCTFLQFFSAKCLIIISYSLP